MDLLGGGHEGMPIVILLLFFSFFPSSLFDKEVILFLLERKACIAVVVSQTHLAVSG